MAARGAGGGGGGYGCVFARALEDRGLLERNRIAGTRATSVAKGSSSTRAFATERRDYLYAVFRELAPPRGGRR
ncbi:MAG: hypothetical protein R3B99_27435 [Polyangiales bacterium]